MNKTIITGASGFIGSYLSKRLPDAAAFSRQSILYGHSYNPDKMFFLSTYGNMAHHNEYSKMVKANVQDLLTILNGFRGWICYMSSSSVLLPVQTPYSRTKHAAEEILQALPELDACIVRPYSVIGVGEQKEHLIPTLIRSCMEGEEMPFDPKPVHDFVDVEDVVDGLIALSETRAIGIFEFGSGVPVTNQQVLDLVESATGRKANIKPVSNLRPYDNPDWYCTSSFYQFFKPKKNIEQSITEMVEAYKNEYL